MKCIFRIDGNNPKMILDSTLFGADTIMFDLFSSVPDGCKDEARYLVAESLPFYDFSGNTVLVQINSTDTSYCKDDISMLTSERPYAFVLPHATAGTVALASSLITDAERSVGIPEGTVNLIPSIADAGEADNIDAIVSASGRICAVLLDTGAVKADENCDITAVRSRVASSCTAAGIRAIDSLPDSISGQDCEAYLSASIRLGFDAVLVLESRQIESANLVFSQER